MTATTPRRQTTHALAAKEIRAKLRAAYPSVRFSVTSRSYAGGNAVDVEWFDGPTSDAVEKIVDVHQYGHFDGMEDLYHYSNRRDDLHQVKYVQVRRRDSPETREKLIALVNARFGWDLAIGATGEWLNDHHTGSGWRSSEIWRTFSALSLVCGSCGTATLPGDRFCGECGAGLPEPER